MDGGRIQGEKQSRPLSVFNGYVISSSANMKWRKGETGVFSCVSVGLCATCGVCVCSECCDCCACSRRRRRNRIETRLGRAEADPSRQRRAVLRWVLQLIKQRNTTAGQTASRQGGNASSILWKETRKTEEGRGTRNQSRNRTESKVWLSLAGCTSQVLLGQCPRPGYR